MDRPAPIKPEPEPEPDRELSQLTACESTNDSKKSGTTDIAACCRLGQAAVRICSVELWCAAIASTLIPIGLLWDFSWENTIGIDRFWSPPHLTVNAGVWLMGLLGVRLVAKFSRTRNRGEQEIGIRIGPLAAPAGAWIFLWGAALFQLALPLDNWWQQAYGLGAGLWHPPQILKAVSFVTILFGAMALSGTQSDLVTGAGLSQPQHVLERSEPLRLGQPRSNVSAFFIWHSGLLLTIGAIFLTVESYANWQHGAWFYKISALIYPAALFAGCRDSKRWAATQTALIYTILLGAMVWLLPLFPAKPLTAPIHNPTDHMLPPAFPLLLFFPAIGFDLLRLKFSGVKLAVLASLTFVITFTSAQWFFAEFLLSPHADNWFFAGGGKHWPFFLKIDQARVMFWNAKQDPITLPAILLTIVFAAISSWLGLQLSSWLNKLRR